MVIGMNLATIKERLFNVHIHEGKLVPFKTFLEIAASSLTTIFSFFKFPGITDPH
jgi:hypothetical protein